MLNLIDEYSRQCLAIRVARRLNSNDVIDTLSDAMILHEFLNIYVQTTAANW